MNNLIKSLLTFALSIVAVVAVHAETQTTFEVNAPMLTVEGEPFRVEFTLNAKPDEDSFVAPSFEGLSAIAGPSTSQGRSIQFINGRQSASYNCTYTYVLMPQAAGNYTIGSAAIKVDGTSYSTKPLPIEVIVEKGTATGGKTQQTPDSRIAQDDILLRLKLSSTEAYKGEAIRASLVLYTRVSIDNIESLTMPPFDGFWSQQLEFENSPSREEYNGKIYETYKINELLLSPQQSGTIVIPEVQMDVRAQVIVQDNKRYDPFFGGRQVYHVTRNLKFITAPRLTLPESFEVYDTKVTDNIMITATGTSGSITYSYPFVARSAGEFTIEPLEFSYFDPTTGE